MKYGHLPSLPTLQMLAEECDGRVPDLAMIGFRALVNTLSSESYKTEEVITSFQPEDFATDAANEKYAELAMQIGQVRQSRIAKAGTIPRCGSNNIFEILV